MLGNMYWGIYACELFSNSSENCVCEICVYIHTSGCICAYTHIHIHRGERGAKLVNVNNRRNWVKDLENCVHYIYTFSVILNLFFKFNN